MNRSTQSDSTISQKSIPTVEKEEKSKYLCRFCHREGHKIFSCRYKKRKEKALKNKQEKQKLKSENNFKSFIAEQLKNVTKKLEVNEDTAAKIIHSIEKKMKDNMQIIFEKLIELIAPFNSINNENNKKEQVAQEVVLAQQKNQQEENEQEDEKQPYNEDENNWNYEMKQALDQQNQLNQNEEDYENYRWEYEVKNSTQEYLPENAWEIEDTFTGFGEDPNQDHDHHHQDQDQNKEKYNYLLQSNSQHDQDHTIHQHQHQRKIQQEQKPSSCSKKKRTHKKDNQNQKREEAHPNVQKDYSSKYDTIKLNVYLSRNQEEVAAIEGEKEILIVNAQTSLIKKKTPMKIRKPKQFQRHYTFIEERNFLVQKNIFEG